MKYPVAKIAPTKTETIIMTGGLHEDTPQLELSAGELIDCLNYQEIDGAYHGYASIPGYERFDGRPVASETNVIGLTDYGTENKTVVLLESDLQDPIVDISSTPHTTVVNNVNHDPLRYKFLRSSYYFLPTSTLELVPEQNTGWQWPADSDPATYITSSRLSLRDEDWTFDLLLTPVDANQGNQVLFQKGMSYRIKLDNHRIIFEFSTNGTTWEATKYTSIRYLSDNQRVHVTVCRRNNFVYMFFDGDIEDDTNWIDISDAFFFENEDNLIIGDGFTGWMDEVRVSNTYRWVADFDIPVKPYSTPGYYTVQVDDIDREIARELIEEVPGTGPILGISIRQGIIGVARDIFNEGSDPVETGIYRADGTGWSAQIPSTKLFHYEAASNINADADPLIGTTQGFIPKDISLEHPLFEGDKITGMTSGATATVRSHVQYGGDFRTPPGDADAYGLLTLENVEGEWVDGENFFIDVGDSVGPHVDVPWDYDTEGATGTIVAGTLEDFILQPGGTYQFIDAAFDLVPNVQREIQPFFVNGVNCPAYYDNDVIIPIIHENLPSTNGVHPVHLADFKNRLWLAYPDGRLWYSEVGNPLGYNTTLGAGEIYLEDEITGLIVAPGDVLVVFCRNSTQIIKTITEYSDSQAGNATLDYGFFNETFSKRSGAIARTPARMLGEIYFLDDRGLTTLSAADTYGDFASKAISKPVQRTLLSKIDQVVTSAISRENNQYRLFFEDKSGLIFTFDHEKSVKGVTKIQYDHRMTCFKEGELDDGTLILLFGSDDGFVYQMDSGTSFDGNVIKTKLTTGFYSYDTPSNWKRFKKLILEAQAGKGLIIKGKPEFNYRDPNVPRSNQVTYTSVGQGGIWGKDAWGFFQYGSGEVQNPTLYLTGYGHNMNITISTEDKHQEPHVINSILVEYSLHSRKM